jgi:hypothetical protein
MGDQYPGKLLPQVCVKAGQEHERKVLFRGRIFMVLRFKIAS